MKQNIKKDHAIDLDQNQYLNLDLVTRKMKLNKINNDIHSDIEKITRYMKKFIHYSSHNYLLIILYLY